MNPVYIVLGSVILTLSLAISYLSRQDVAGAATSSSPLILGRLRLALYLEGFALLLAGLLGGIPLLHSIASGLGVAGCVILVYASVRINQKTKLPR